MVSFETLVFDVLELQEVIVGIQVDMFPNLLDWIDDNPGTLFAVAHCTSLWNTNTDILASPVWSMNVASHTQIELAFIHSCTLIVVPRIVSNGGVSYQEVNVAWDPRQIN
jgi:hypothetical protein